MTQQLLDIFILELLQIKRKKNKTKNKKKLELLALPTPLNIMSGSRSNCCCSRKFEVKFLIVHIVVHGTKTMMTSCL